MTDRVYNGVPYCYNELKNAYGSDVVAQEFKGFAKKEKAAVEKANELPRGVGEEDVGEPLKDRRGRWNWSRNVQLRRPENSNCRRTPKKAHSEGVHGSFADRNKLLKMSEIMSLNPERFSLTERYGTLSGYEQIYEERRHKPSEP